MNCEHSHARQLKKSLKQHEIKQQNYNKGKKEEKEKKKRREREDPKQRRH